MTEERMHFGNTMAELNVMYLAEHVVRYAALAPWVRGRRVLDIACGEGYGSWLLKEWGASSVLGVDVSEEAVSAAQRHFARESVQYIAADACHVAEQLPHGSFDLIASFETIEHVRYPERFLAGLRSLAAPGAQIVISCPNDHVALPPDQSNPYHLRKYTFEEFKVCCEGVLGPASDWLLGVNVQGYALVSECSALIQDTSGGKIDMIRAGQPCAAHLLPSQHNVRPDRASVLYYMGVWGAAPVVGPVAVSAQSYQAFIEPWRALDWFKAERERVQSEQELAAAERIKLSAQAQAAAEQLADARRQIVALNGVIARFGSDARSRGDTSVSCLDHRSNADRRLAELQAQHDAVLQSRSWRLTRGLRVVARLMRGEFGHVKASFLARWRGR